jgi:hypothetical protein
MHLPGLYKVIRSDYQCLSPLWHEEQAYHPTPLRQHLQEIYSAR